MSPILTIETQAKQTRNEARPDIFARLERRGVNYAQVKAIVQLDLPQTLLHFSCFFPGVTIGSAFRKLGRSEALLRSDFVISHFGDLKSQVERRLNGLSLIAIHALIEANAIGGTWNLRVEFQPTVRDEKGRAMYINPLFRIVATHRKRKKSFAVQLRKGEGVTAVKRAFAEKGIWEELWKEDPSRLLVSRRAEQGWPVFTRIVIPQLYEYLIPYYPASGHHWARHGVRTNPLAQLPQNLFEDMLEILQLEHPHVFKETTLPQLRSAAQRHLKSTKELSRQKS